MSPINRWGNNANVVILFILVLVLIYIYQQFIIVGLEKKLFNKTSKIVVLIIAKQHNNISAFIHLLKIVYFRVLQKFLLVRVNLYIINPLEQFEVTGIGKKVYFPDLFP